MTSYFQRAAPIAKSSGNLFAPPAVRGGIDGGLRSPRRRNGALAAVAMAGSLILFGLAMRASQARR